MRGDYLGWTLTGRCRRQAVHHGEREFPGFEDGTRLSFAHSMKTLPRCPCCTRAMPTKPTADEYL